MVWGRGRERGVEGAKGVLFFFGVDPLKDTIREVLIFSFLLSLVREERSPCRPFHVPPPYKFAFAATASHDHRVGQDAAQGQRDARDVEESERLGKEERAGDDDDQSPALVGDGKSDLLDLVYEFKVQSVLCVGVSGVVWCGVRVGVGVG